MAETASIAWTDEELRAKVGQLFVVGFHGHVPSDDIKTLIKVHKVGTVILFLRNVASASQLLELTNSLQATAKDAGHQQGLLIAIDQENGLVTRIKSPVAAQLPGSMALGATGDAKNAYKVATATAETLKSFGINMNYAPIADVNSEPKNPVIGVRSPSDDPETVARFVSAQVKGLSEGGIVPCVKHFPGHGDTAVDSHYGLPVISKTKAELDACELVPFRRVFVEGVDSVMTAHIAMPGIGDASLDDDHPSKKVPASLNPDAIKILREELKYDGMVVSDCLEMDGVRATFGTEEGAVMALKAGSDCVMVCHTMSAQVGAIERVIQAVKDGELSQDTIAASVKRVETLKTKYIADTAPIPNSSLEHVEARNTRQAKMAAEIYAKSTTLVRSENGLLPISSNCNKKTVFISPGKTPPGGGAVEIGEEKTREPYTPDSYIDVLHAHDPTIAHIRFRDGIEMPPEEEKLVLEADTLIFATRNATQSPYQKKLGLSLGEKFGKKLIVVATCDPYDFLVENDLIKNYITIYEPTIPAFNSAADVIFGVMKPMGKLPVGSSGPEHDIKTFDGSDEEAKKISEMWHVVFPKWPISLPRLTKILLRSHGRHYIHEGGFCLSFFMDGPHGKIASLGVLPEYRGKGIGTALLKKAQRELTSMAEASGQGPLKSLAIGSDSPRLWCEVPVDFSQAAKDFLMHRGFRHPTKPTAQDLYRDITKDVAPPEILAKVAKLPLKFSPWSAELYEETMTKQRANFKGLSWIGAYEQLAAWNQYHQVMVAFDAETNSQVGWTLMCDYSIISNNFAFLPLMPSKEKTGLIACVGVDESARGKGVGLVLMVKAMENMKERGIEGVCVDWVVIKGFYERLGFQRYWEYQGFEW
ncbi:putative beta-N-acetylglucosaminidase [Mollisia scopiformis]|uniref:Putative beta-N-acetylglucosaminidase n=1 Tax=Mollisia scopiformis TaxID=149040 RepID=A0A194XIW0_MOLSC|nr:putative beta-N-acetylglucosaminidase [Mollisia scopiformis]KUJ20071.1 putative beta-N-acetylglucosaminidase [Mollisia scopiformis]